VSAQQEYSQNYFVEDGQEFCNEGKQKFFFYKYTGYIVIKQAYQEQYRPNTMFAMQ
jgi:hypothetical protein